MLFAARRRCWCTGQVSEAYNAAPRTRLMCAMMRGFRLVRVVSICLCFANAVLPRRAISAMMAAVGSPKVSGVPRAGTIVCRGWHPTVSPLMVKVSSVGWLHRTAVLSGWFPLQVGEETLQMVAVLAPEVGVIQEGSPRFGGGGGPPCGSGGWAGALERAAWRSLAMIAPNKSGESGEPCLMPFDWGTGVITSLVSRAG